MVAGQGLPGFAKRVSQFFRSTHHVPYGITALYSDNEARRTWLHTECDQFLNMADLFSR